MVCFADDVYDQEELDDGYHSENPSSESFALKPFHPDFNVYAIRRVHELDTIEEILQNVTQSRHPESYLILDPDGHSFGPDCRRADCKHNEDVHHTDLEKWDREDYRTLLLNCDPEIAVDLQQVDIMDPMSEGWLSFLIKFKICGEEKFSCSFGSCRSQFKRPEDWKKHFRSHKSPWKCHLCLDKKLEYHQIGGFKHHLQTHHKDQWSEQNTIKLQGAQSKPSTKSNDSIYADGYNESMSHLGNTDDSRSQRPAEWSRTSDSYTQQQRNTNGNDCPDIAYVSSSEESNSMLFAGQRAISQESPSRVRNSQYLSDSSTSIDDALSLCRSPDGCSEDWSEDESWSTLEDSGDLKPSLSHYRREILESCMVVFWAMMNRLWKSPPFQRTVAQSSNPSPSHSPSRSQAIPTQSPTALQRAQKINRGRPSRDFNEDEGEDEDEERPPKRLKNNEREPPDAVEKLKYACPYRKHNRRQYNMHTHRTCALTSFVSTHRMKEHLYRTHRAKVHCPRCSIELEDKQALETHLQSEVICQKNRGQPIDGFDIEIERRLRCRKKDFPNQTEAQKWAAIYGLLFPGKEVPSPYFEPPQDDPLPPQTSIEDYIRQDVPRRARMQLESQFATTQNPNLTRDQVIAQMVDMIVTIINSSLYAYRSTLSEKKDVAQTITPPREPPSPMLAINLGDSGPLTQTGSATPTTITTIDSRTDMFTSALQSQFQVAGDMTTPDQVSTQAVAASPNVTLSKDSDWTSPEPTKIVPFLERNSQSGVDAGLLIHREFSKQDLNMATTSNDIDPLSAQEIIELPPYSYGGMILSNGNESLELFNQPADSLRNFDTSIGLELLDDFRLDFDTDLNVDWNFPFMNLEAPLEGTLPDQT